MEAEIIKLMRYMSREDPGEECKEMILTEGVGIEGNGIQNKDKQICMFSVEARKWMEDNPIKGLCFKRFRENITVKGIQLDSLKEGTILSAGDAELKITHSGKPCFDECTLYSNSIHCKLSKNATFLAVEKGGVIKIGTKILINQPDRDYLQ